MSVFRRWYCRCSGEPRELNYERVLEDETLGEPFCDRCGATPSSDPRHTITFKDEEDYED
ncbi:MAG: hypothetical protein AB7F20_10540 [Geoalkalibacter sp.]|uniref:hypothetical protein n=1 Tax=Geoalkalibacter sp. TaxID=3041440 RepID=UPI002A932788|nr:hypothetical protein [Thermodesulfobacteriota bacterium]